MIDLAPWPVVRLGDHVHKPQYGYTASANHEPVGPRLLRITDIQAGRVVWQRVPFCDCPDNKRQRYLLEPGDLVVARIGATTGKAHMVRSCPEAVFASYLIRLRARPTLAPAFLALFCESRSYWAQIERNKGGRLKGGVNLGVLNDLMLPLPPMDEQWAIARALSAVQEAKEARLRELELERERKAALMEHLLTYGTRGEPTKQTEIGEMPKSWSTSVIGDMATEVRSGVTPRGGSKTYLTEGVPLIRSQNVRMNRMALEDIAHIAPAVHRSMRRSAVQPGDVLLNITGASIGRVACVPTRLPDANVNQHVCRIRFNTDHDPAFMSQYLSWPPSQARIMGAQFGTTRQGLNYGQVRALKVPLLSLNEQRMIGSALALCDDRDGAIRLEVARLDELFASLLEELMNGRLSAGALIKG
jgi:type I restriction enzyme, S subunit